MLVLSLTTILQEAAADPRSKHGSGNIQSFDELLKPANLQMLEASHGGMFAFLAFHPAVDSSLVAYVRSGTLASDSGPNILALFTLDAQARWPTSITNKSFESWLVLDTSSHPSYALIRILFEPKTVPPLPGIVFFDSFVSETEAVYVNLSRCAEGQEIRMYLRECFALADKVWRDSKTKSGDTFASRLSVALLAEKAHYFVTGRTSMREWLVQGLRFLEAREADIVAPISMDVGM